jgi:ferredoxin
VLQYLLLDPRLNKGMKFFSAFDHAPNPGETGPEFWQSRLCWDIMQTVAPGVRTLWVGVWADGTDTKRLDSMHPVVLTLMNIPLHERHIKNALRHVGVLCHVFGRKMKGGRALLKTADEKRFKQQLYHDAMGQIINALEHYAKQGINLVLEKDGEKFEFAVRQVAQIMDMSDQNDYSGINVCSGRSVCGQCHALDRTAVEVSTKVVRDEEENGQSVSEEEDSDNDAVVATKSSAAAPKSNAAAPKSAAATTSRVESAAAEPHFIIGKARNCSDAPKRT